MDPNAPPLYRWDGSEQKTVSNIGTMTFSGQKTDLDVLDFDGGVLLPNLAAHVNEPIFAKDRELRYSFVNPAFCRLFNLSSSEILGRTDIQLLGASTAAKIQPNDTRLLAGEQVADEIVEYPAGVPDRFLMTRIPLYGSGGTITGLCAVLHTVPPAIVSEKNEPHSITKLELLNRATAELAALPPEKDLYRFVAEKISELTNAVFVGVSEYLSETDSLVTRALVGRGLVAKFEEHLGRHPVGVTYALPDDEVRAQIMSGGLTKIPGGLYEVAFRSVPKTLASLTETVLGIGELHGMGFVWQKELFGVTVIALRRGATIDRHLIETFGLQTSIALQRNRFEEESRSSERRFRLMVQNSHDALVVLEGDGKIRYISPAIERIGGIPPETMIGRRIFSFLPARVAEQGRTLLAEALPHLGATIKLENTIQRFDGSPVDIEVVGTNLLHDPSVNGIVLNIRDISERKQAERALRESERKFRVFIEQSADGFQLSDEDGLVIEWNAANEALTGISREDAIGRPIWELQTQLLALDQNPAETAELLRRTYLESMRTGEVPFVGPVELCLRRPDGEQQYVLHTLFPIRTTSGYWLGGVNHNITARRRAEQERERLEEQFREAQKMESIGRLAGGVAHDFNNLLTGIMGNVELALLELSPHDPLLPLLSEVAKATNSASALTRHLLAFSRKQVIARKVVNLNTLIADMHKMIGRLIGEDIRLAPLQDRPVGNVRVDPTQIEQVIINLVVNARDAMPHGGDLIIDASDVNLDRAFCQTRPEVQPGRYVLLTVTDTGIGMSEEVRAHVFEPFFTTKPQGKGTGLGMAMVYGTVRQNEGFVEIDSQLGRGTRVRIYFPRIDEEAEASARMVASHLPTGCETIFLAEDEQVVRELAVKILTRLGYRVFSFADGESALAAAADYPDTIHLLLTDVVMPGMNGRELGKRLTKLRPETKVLYTSGYAEEVIALHGVLEPGLDFIPKPYSPRAIATAVREILDRKGRAQVG